MTCRLKRKSWLRWLFRWTTGSPAVLQWWIEYQPFDAHCIWLNISIVFGWISSSYLVDVLRCTFFDLHCIWFRMSPLPLSIVFNHANLLLLAFLKKFSVGIWPKLSKRMEAAKMNGKWMAHWFLAADFTWDTHPHIWKLSVDSFRRIWFLGKVCKKKTTTIEECQ